MALMTMMAWALLQILPLQQIVFSHHEQLIFTVAEITSKALHSSHAHGPNQYLSLLCCIYKFLLQKMINLNDLNSL